VSKDWRLENLETQPYLRGVSLARKMYRAYRPGWDHDHCVGCWTKLAEPGIEGADVVHEGYATTAEFVRGAEYEWACVSCFEAFSEAMGWIDVTKANSN
jgi:hypothetical protein